VNVTSLCVFVFYTGNCRIYAVEPGEALVTFQRAHVCWHFHREVGSPKGSWCTDTPPQRNPCPMLACTNTIHSCDKHGSAKTTAGVPCTLHPSSCLLCTPSTAHHVSQAPREAVLLATAIAVLIDIKTKQTPPRRLRSWRTTSDCAAGKAT